MSMKVKLLASDEEIARLCPVLLQLRPQYDASSLTEQIKLQLGEGFQLAYVEETTEETSEADILCVAGFVVGHKLAWQKYLYIDDLVSDGDSRSRGAGKLLLDWLQDYARQQGCQQLHLDSGVTRFDAHRFYLREGMKIASHHFSIDDLSSQE